MHNVSVYRSTNLVYCILLPQEHACVSTGIKSFSTQIDRGVCDP